MVGVGRVRIGGYQPGIYVPLNALFSSIYSKDPPPLIFTCIGFNVVTCL